MIEQNNRNNESTINPQRKVEILVEKWLNKKIKGKLILDFPGDGKSVVVKVGEMSEESTLNIFTDIKN